MGRNEGGGAYEVQALIGQSGRMYRTEKDISDWSEQRWAGSGAGVGWKGRTLMGWSRGRKDEPDWNDLLGLVGDSRAEKGAGLKE